MGYAGNSTPSYVIPTVVGCDDKTATSSVSDAGRGKMDDLDFFVGDDVRGAAACVGPRFRGHAACVWAFRRPLLGLDIFS